MISVMKQSYTVLSLKVDRHTLNRVLAVFAAVWRGTRTTVEAMQSEVAIKVWNSLSFSEARIGI